MHTKQSLRRTARARRDDLGRALPDFAARIAAFAEELPVTADAAVAGYWPVRGEADPRGLMRALEARGAVPALPAIIARDAPLVFRRWREGDALIDNHHRIPEPRGDAPPVVPDIILVPLLAFDADGHRLGYGGGYYDRTLDALRAARVVLAVGIAYAGQEVARLPRETHDHRLDLIVTENGVRRF